MRAILVAMLVSAGIYLVGTAGVFSAPVSGAAVIEAAAGTIMTEQAQRCRCVSRRWDGSCRTRVCRPSW